MSDLVMASVVKGGGFGTYNTFVSSLRAPDLTQRSGESEWWPGNCFISSGTSMSAVDFAMPRLTVEPAGGAEEQP